MRPRHRSLPPQSAAATFAVVLNERGCVDLDHVAELLQRMSRTSFLTFNALNLIMGHHSLIISNRIQWSGPSRSTTVLVMEKIIYLFSAPGAMGVFNLKGLQNGRRSRFRYRSAFQCKTEFG
jgi:hypothetical protein